jgi:lysozyme
MMTNEYLETHAVRGMQAGALPLSFRIRHFLAARGPVIPPAERVPGIDTSHWNGNMNYATSYVVGDRFVILKASQGTLWGDNQYLPGVERLRVQDNMPWSSYHFLTTADGVAQANWFYSKAKNTLGVIPPVVDVELASVAASIVRACVQQIYNVVAFWPIIYTSSYYWSLVVGDSDKRWISDRCKLFVAHWGTDYPILPTGWSDYVLHQYSAENNQEGPRHGAPPGAEPDMDLDRCRRLWFEQYAPPVAVPVAEWAHNVDPFLRGLGYTGPSPE